MFLYRLQLVSGVSWSIWLRHKLCTKKQIVSSGYKSLCCHIPANSISVLFTNQSHKSVRYSVIIRSGINKATSYSNHDREQKKCRFYLSKCMPNIKNLYNRCGNNRWPSPCTSRLGIRWCSSCDVYKQTKRYILTVDKEQNKNW